MCKPYSGQEWVNEVLWALPPYTSNRNQACREGFLGDWPGREPIICKRWELGLSQKLPESLLPVRDSLREAKPACNNWGFVTKTVFLCRVGNALHKGRNSQIKWVIHFGCATFGYEVVVILLQSLCKLQWSKAHEMGAFLYPLVNSKQSVAFT